MIDVLVRLLVVARDDGDVAAIDDPEEGQEIDVVFEHVGKILRRGLANACRALRGSGAHDLALIPRHADEAHLGAHGADGVAVGRAIGRAQEGGDALRLEGAVVQLRRIDVIVGALVLMGSAMLMRHVLPGHGCGSSAWLSLRAVAMSALARRIRHRAARARSRRAASHAPSAPLASAARNRGSGNCRAPPASSPRRNGCTAP